MSWVSWTAQLRTLTTAWVLTAVPVLVSAQPPGGELLGKGFEAFTGIPPSAAKELDDSRLDELRGKQRLVYFDLSGEVDVDGPDAASARVVAGFVGPDGTFLPVPGSATAPAGLSGKSALTSVEFNRIDEGAFERARGLISLIQNTGDNNSISSRINVNLYVLNIGDRGSLPGIQKAIESRAFTQF